jgi:hypothetical protein
MVAKGTTGAQKKAELAKQLQFPVSAYHCPSRGSVESRISFGRETPLNADTPPGERLFKTDYAGNGGSYCPDEGVDFDGSGGEPTLGFTPGPPESCLSSFPNCDWDDFTEGNVKNYLNGAVSPRFPVEVQQISDGTSNTILIAEKYLHESLYFGSEGDFSTDACADNGGALQGYDWDNIRWATSRTNWNGTPLKKGYAPMPDTYTNPTSGLAEKCTVRFGGPHAVFNAVYCDGSVRALEFDIDLAVLEGYAARNDEGVVGDVSRR